MKVSKLCPLQRICDKVLKKAVTPIYQMRVTAL